VLVGIRGERGPLLFADRIIGNSEATTKFFAYAYRGKGRNIDQRDSSMRFQTKIKRLDVAILTGALAVACGPFVTLASAQADSVTVIGSRAPGSEAVAGNDTGGTIPNSSYSGTGPAPAAAIPDHPAVDTPTPIETPSPAVKRPPMPLGTNGMKSNSSDMPLQ